jgi:hypothetical protein
LGLLVLLLALATEADAPAAVVVLAALEVSVVEVSVVEATVVEASVVEASVVVLAAAEVSAAAAAVVVDPEDWWPLCLPWLWRAASVVEAATEVEDWLLFLFLAAAEATAGPDPR